MNASAEMPKRWMVVKVDYIDDDKHWLCELASIMSDLGEQEVTRRIRFSFEVRLGSEVLLKTNRRTGKEVFRVRRS